MSRRTEKNVGVIGLGIIGRRVSERLRRRGFSVFVWNRTPRPFPNFVGSPAEIAHLADYIQIFVADDDALLETVQQLKMTLNAHHVVMAHCTVAPHTMRAAAEIVQRRGAQFLDAPFTGSKVAAEKGELVYYIGGDEAAFRRARPVLEASSKEIVEIGEVGQATIIKIATNMVTAATVQVAGEALALVRTAGMTADKFAAAMRGNASNSATLTMKLPKMISGDFDPHFSLKHMLKDVEIASRFARTHGLSLGATEAARSSLLEEMRQNRGDYDYTSMVRGLVPAPPPSEPEATESDHPLLDLKESAPNEAGATWVKAEDSAPALEAVAQEESPPLVEAVFAEEDVSSVEAVAAETREPPVETVMAEESAPPVEAVVAEEKSSPEAVEEKTLPAEPEAVEEKTLPAEPEAVEEKTSPVAVEATEVKVAPMAVEAAEAKSEPPEAKPEPVEEPVAVRSEPEVDDIFLEESQTEGKTEFEDFPVADKSENENKADAAREGPPVDEPVKETTPVSKEAAAPETERRGFFSRIFSKTTHEEDPDY